MLSILDSTKGYIWPFERENVIKYTNYLTKPFLGVHFKVDFLYTCILLV